MGSNIRKLRKNVSGKTTSARARIRVTLEVEVPGGSWGPDCTMDQIYRQAREDGLRSLSRLLQSGRDGFTFNGCKQRVNATVVDAPRVLAVIVEDA